MVKDSIHNHGTGCLVGLAVGDAVGTTLEFKPRGSFEPLTDMVGGGPFGLEKGQWTDDTSMALCLAESLIEKKNFCPVDQLERYQLWRTKGHLSSTGTCFDIGLTVSAALNRFGRTGEPYCGSTSDKASGNGALMRMAPIAMFCHSDESYTIKWAIDSSRTTHASEKCLASAGLFAFYLRKLILGGSKEDLLEGHEVVWRHLSFEPDPAIRAIAEGQFLNKSMDEIKGSAYVVESLEASLWCFFRADDFKDAVLMAANLGDDADTTAAIIGQLAGAYYGQSAIPADWCNALHGGSKIMSYADKLIELST